MSQIDTDHVFRGEVVAWNNIQPTNLVISNLVTISLEDGSLTYHEGYVPDLAAQAFWQAMSNEYAGFLRWKSKQAE